MRLTTVRQDHVKRMLRKMILKCLLKPVLENSSLLQNQKTPETKLKNNKTKARKTVVFFLSIFRKAGRNLALDTAVILAAEDFNVAVITPVSVPRVGNEPVRGSVLNSPAKDADGVAAESLAVDVLVNSWKGSKWIGWFELN